MNRKNIRNVRALIRSICLGVTFIYAGVGQAQAGEGVTPAQFGTKLKTIDRQLISIEALVAQIEAAKTDKDKDKFADDLEPSLDAYAKAMLASINTALKQAELSAKSNGKEGNIELLKSFEDLAVKHEVRLKKLEGRTRKLEPKSKSSSNSKPGECGSVAFDPPMLEESGHFSFVSLVSPSNLAVKNLGGSGQGAIALAVYGVTSDKNSTLAAKIKAIANGVLQTDAANAAYTNCWNGLEGTKPKWWRALKRSWCVVVLVARLA